MKRRDFLAAVGASAASARLGGPTDKLPLRSRLDRIGLELYSVRDAMTADPEQTLKAVRDMGYADVELLWSFKNFGRSAQQVRDTLRTLGLRAPSAHIAPEILLANWQQSLDTANYLGHQYLIVPSLPTNTRTSLDSWRYWAGIFNKAGMQARNAGLWLAFHNEPEHQQLIEGQNPYELFVRETDSANVRLQLDVGNMLMGGGDPHAALALHRDRYWSFHLKDVTADRKHDTVLGAGTFDFQRFLAAVPDLKQKPCYIEEENPVDAMANARKNCRYLRDLRF